MAIPEQLGFGKTGWHGDQAVSFRSSLNTPSIQTMLNELKLDHNAALALLDGEGGDADYAATLAVTGEDITVTAASEHVANGSSYAHGDDAVKLKQSNGVALLHEIKTKHNALLVKLDADGAFANDYVDAARTAAEFSTAGGDFGQGGSSTHGDAGVAIRRGLEGRVALANELKAKHNLVMVKLDADVTVQYVAAATVAAADLA